MDTSKQKHIDELVEILKLDTYQKHTLYGKQAITKIAEKLEKEVLSKAKRHSFNDLKEIK